MPHIPQNNQNVVTENEKKSKEVFGKLSSGIIEVKKFVPNRIIYRPQTAAHNIEFCPKKPLENNVEQKVVIQRLGNNR